MESWNFSTWQFFSTNNISDISDKYEVCENCLRRVQGCLAFGDFYYKELSLVEVQEKFLAT